MRKKAALLLALVILTSSYTIAAKPVSAATPVENSWTSKEPIPKEAILGGLAAAANSEVYLIGDSANYEYDPVTDNWTARTPMPTPKTVFSIAAYQNKIYTIGSSAIQVYDPITDTWQSKTPIPTSIYSTSANVVDGKIYVTGGRTDNFRSFDTAVNEVYDPATDSWTTKRQMPIAAVYYASAVVDNKIYIMRGYTLQIYDAESDTWTVGASTPISIEGGTAAATTGVFAPKRVYVFGGGHTITWNAVRVYDPASGNWTLGAPMPTNRTGLAVAVVNDALYAMGGASNYEGVFPVGSYYYSSIIEQYTPFGYGTVPQEFQPTPFPTMLIVVSLTSVAVVGMSLLVYFKKRKQAG